MVPGAKVESRSSAAARARAARFGAVVGSSYTTASGQPVAWAFDIACSRFPAGERLVLAGAEGLYHDVFLLVPEEEAFTGMLLGKGLASEADVGSLKPRGLVAGEVVVSLASEHAAWVPVGFYLCPARFDPRCRERDLAATGLHAGEQGLSEGALVRALRARTPEGLTSMDPLHDTPFHDLYAAMVRSARRLSRLEQLATPPELLDRERELARKSAALARSVGWDPALAPLPRDVAGVIAALGGRRAGGLGFVLSPPP